MNANPKPFPLSDADWRRLSSIVGLPDAARAELENVLTWTRYIGRVDADSVAPHITKKRLSEIDQKVADLVADLNSIRAHEPDVFGALVSPEEDEFASAPWPGRPPLRFLRAQVFEDHLHSLQQLREYLQYAGGHLRKGERGDKTAAAHVMTREIDALLQRHTTSYKLTRTAKTVDPAKEFFSTCLTLLRMEEKPDSIIRWLERGRQSSSETVSETLP